MTTRPKLLQNLAHDAPDNQVDDLIRYRLTAMFKPLRRTAYDDVLPLPWRARRMAWRLCRSPRRGLPVRGATGGHVHVTGQHCRRDGTEPHSENGEGGDEAKLPGAVHSSKVSKCSTHSPRARDSAADARACPCAERLER